MTPLASYPGDLTDEQWALVSPLLSREGQRGRPQTYDLRRVFNGCVYILNAGCSWRHLPKDAYPPWPCVYKHYRHWLELNLFETLTLTLNRAVRVAAERKETPSTGIVDAHSLKSQHGGEAIGFDGNKKIRGRKNQLLTDTLGLIWGVHTHAANLSDTREVIPLLNRSLQTLETIQRLYLDKGYRGTGVDHVEELDLTAIVPENGLGTQAKGFKPVAVRWRVERSIAWITRFRRLANSYERTIKSCVAFTWLAGCLIALGKLTGGRQWQKKKIGQTEVGN